MNGMNLVAVRYIGDEQAWFDRLYGSQMWFERGKVYRLQHKFSRKLLAHSDLFEQVPDEELENSESENNGDNQEHSENGNQANGQNDDNTSEEEQQNALFDLFARIDQMDKDALSVFILENFSQKVDGRLSEQTLREQAKNLIDRFGMPK